MSPPTAQRHNEVNLLIPTSARTILVVGCGDGALGYFLKRARPSAEVSGVEMSPAAAKARELLDRVYSGQLDVLAEKIPAGYFDAIIFSDVFERVTSPHRAIVQLKRCLKPQGTVVVTARNARYWPVLRAILEDGYGGGTGRERLATPADLETPRLLSKAAVIGLLEAAGFEVSLIRPVREAEETGMPESILLAIERELNLTGTALAEETKDSAYMLTARPATASLFDAGSVAESNTAGGSGTASETSHAGGTAGLVPLAGGGIPPSPTMGKGTPTGSVPALPPVRSPVRSPVNSPVNSPVKSSAAAKAPAKGKPQPPPKRRPIASIVALTWNQKDLTEKLLRAIENTTKVPHEIIVVDNGSTDDTAAFLKAYAEEWAAKGLDIRSIANARNIGVPKGFNQGIKEAKGEYIILLHNDIVLASNWLERMIRHFRANKKIGMVGPRSNSAKPHQSAPLGYRDLGEFPPFAETFYARHQGSRTKVDSLGGFCVAIRRDVLAKTGMFDESYEIAGYEDDDLCMRARKCGYEVVVADDIYVHHTGSASFKKNDVNPLEFSGKNRQRFIDNWGLKPSIVYVMRWAAQSAAASMVFRQINDLASLGYEPRVISFEGRPEFPEVKAEFQRVGAFEMLPPLEEDIVVVCSALDLPTIAQKCRGKLVHLCLGYESYAYGSAAEDIKALKPQIERYHSVPCARIVASGHLRDLFADKFNQSTLLVPGWVDPVLGSPRQTVWPGVAENASILFVGRPVLPKGIADFTAAIRAVRVKYPGVKMHLAVPARTIGTQEKAEAMFDGQVELHTALSKTEMESLYRLVDMAVFPSWYEGSPIQVVEAMVCGTPVIVADSPGVQGVCKDGENALIVPPAYPRKLAKAMMRLIEDEGLRQRLSAEAPKVAPRYAREVSVKALQESMDKIFRWEVIPPDFKPAAESPGMRVTPGLTSIVTVTFNALEFTQKCLDSVFANSDRDPFELIVVDNGSTDGTWPYLEDLARKRQNVSVLRNHHNAGFAHAANQGIFLARGEFVVTLHSDTVVTRGWLRRLKRTASAVPGAGLVGPVSNHVTGEQAVEAADLRTMDQIQGFAGAMAVRVAGQAVEVNRLSGFCLMIKREVLDRVGVMDSLFPAIGFEDDDISVRVRLAGLKCVIARDVFVYHFRGRSFSDNVMDRDKTMEQNRRRFLRKWAALLKADSGGEDRLFGAPLTGPERLARRIAERASASPAADEIVDYLPPEETGPFTGAPARDSSRESSRGATDVRDSTGVASASDASDASSASPASNASDASEDPSSRDFTALHAKADAQLRAGRFIIALAMCEQILKTDPLDVQARYNASVCAVQTGDTRRARRYLNSLLSEPHGSIAIDGLTAQPTERPSVAAIYNLLGVSFLAERDFSAASSCFEKALSVDPAFGEAVENLRLAHERMAAGR